MPQFMIGLLRNERSAVYAALTVVATLAVLAISGTINP